MKVLHQLGTNLNARDKHGWTAIKIAVDKGHIDCLKVLHELGVNINATTDTHGLTLAAAKGQIDCMRALHKLGANLNARRADGKMALMHEPHEHDECVRVLRQLDADRE